LLFYRPDPLPGSRSPRAAMADPPEEEEELLLDWNMRNLDIRSRTVERTLQPLVLQVTTLCTALHCTALHCTLVEG
jgi:hypothetical protein